MCLLSIHIIQFYLAVHAYFAVCPICFVQLSDVDVEENIGYNSLTLCVCTYYSYMSFMFLLDE
jgi:hypothetical protein